MAIGSVSNALHSQPGHTWPGTPLAILQLPGWAAVCSYFWMRQVLAFMLVSLHYRTSSPAGAGAGAGEPSKGAQKEGNEGDRPTTRVPRGVPCCPSHPKEAPSFRALTHADPSLGVLSDSPHPSPVGLPHNCSPSGCHQCWLGGPQQQCHLPGHPPVTHHLSSLGSIAHSPCRALWGQGHSRATCGLRSWKCCPLALDRVIPKVEDPR